MSPPDHFSIDYSINPWMQIDNPVNKKTAQSQWLSLKRTYQDFGFTITEIPAAKDHPDLVFTTDHGVWINDTFYLSNFRYPERQVEQKLIYPWYKQQQIKTHSIPSIYFLEGGDVLVHHGQIYLGYGFRTSQESAEYLHNTTHLPVISLDLIDEAFYHLDTCLLPLSKEIALYYPQAFSLSGIKKLKQSFDILIPLTAREAENFACNSVIIGSSVLCQPNLDFEKRLFELGFTPVPLSMTEFNKSGGGIHCLSQIIDLM